MVLDSTLEGGLEDAQSGSLIRYSTALSFGQTGWRGGKVWRAEFEQATQLVTEELT